MNLMVALNVRKLIYLNSFILVVLLLVDCTNRSTNKNIIQTNIKDNYNLIFKNIKDSLDQEKLPILTDITIIKINSKNKPVDARIYGLYDNRIKKVRYIYKNKELVKEVMLSIDGDTLYSNFIKQLTDLKSFNYSNKYISILSDLDTITSITSDSLLLSNQDIKYIVKKNESGIKSLSKLDSLGKVWYDIIFSYYEDDKSIRKESHYFESQLVEVYYYDKFGLIEKYKYFDKSNSKVQYMNLFYKIE